MAFKKILCAVDFSAGSKQALATAVRLANESAAELVIVHAWNVPPLAFGGEVMFAPSLVQDVADAAAAGLADALGDAQRAGAKLASTRLMNGVPWSEIVELLEHQAFDLAVIGTHGRTGLSRVLLGSVAEKIVRHAPCPVLTVRPANEPHPFQRILCPIDFSERSRHALELAAKLASPGGAGLTVLHVLELPVGFAGDLPADFGSDIDLRSLRMLDEWVTHTRTLTDVVVTARKRLGSPGSEALQLLEQEGPFDLVVVGSHGRTGIKRVLLGSVAEKLVRHASCPVLVARER